VLTDSPLLLGLVGAMQFIPVLLLSLVAGVVVDRVSKRNLIIFTQASLGMQAFILAALVYTGRVQYWHVLVLAALQGVCTAFDNPARQSFIVDMVGKEHLMNAVALNSAIFNGARIIGPALGGLTMDAFGPALAFFLNGLSYIFVIGALLAMNLPKTASAVSKRRDFRSEVLEGLQYAKQTPIIRNTLLLVGVIGVFALNFNIIVPVLARDVLQQQATGYGVLLSFMGAGALLGAVTLAWFSHHGPRPVLLFTGVIALTTIQIFLALPISFLIASLFLFFAGWAQITYSATANSTLQVNSPDHLRGRVMSLYSLLHGGSAPFGNMFAGTVTSIYGASGGFLACGSLGLGMSLVIFYFTKRSKQPTSLPSTRTNH